MVKIGFCKVGLDPEIYSAVMDISGKSEEDQILRDKVCGGIPAEEMGGNLVVQILRNKTYGYCWYTRMFSEQLPEYSVKEEPEIFNIIEQLRLKYGGSVPIGPWPLSFIHDLGPLKIAGQAIAVSGPGNLSISDTIKMFDMPYSTQVWRWKQLKELVDMDGTLRLSMINTDESGQPTEKADNSPFEIGKTPALKKFGKDSNKLRQKSLSDKQVLNNKKTSGHSGAHEHSFGHKERAFSSKIGSMWTCSVCKYESKDGSNMTKHLKKHNKTAQYKCSICTKTFNDRSNYNVHVKRHQNKRDYKCDTCGKYFSAPNNLRSHKLIHEKGTNIYSGRCGLTHCKKFGENFKDLLMHLKKAHRISSLQNYNKELLKDKGGFRSGTVRKPCDCREHDVWIYRWVGKRHNCYLCDCKLSFRAMEFANGEIKYIRLCKYKV